MITESRAIERITVYETTACEKDRHENYNGILRKNQKMAIETITDTTEILRTKDIKQEDIEQLDKIIIRLFPQIIKPTELLNPGEDDKYKNMILVNQEKLNYGPNQNIFPTIKESITREYQKEINKENNKDIDPVKMQYLAVLYAMASMYEIKESEQDIKEIDPNKIMFLAGIIKPNNIITIRAIRLNSLEQLIGPNTQYPVIKRGELIGYNHSKTITPHTNISRQLVGVDEAHIDTYLAIIEDIKTYYN